MALKPSFLRLISFIAGTMVMVAVPSMSHAAATIDHPIVKLRSLDKTSARTSVFEVNVGATVKFGEIYIKAQSCRKASELEQPESAAFLQIWEVKQPEAGEEQGKAEWIFSGWMFASSPGLSSMDHPIYDVWVLDCLEEKAETTPDDIAHDEIKEGEGEIDETSAPDVTKPETTLEE